MRVKYSLKLRFIAALLAAVALFTSMPLGIFAVGTSSSETDTPSAENVSVEILHNGSETNSVTVSENGTETLTSRIDGTSFTKRSWQILDPERNEWVNVYGKTQDSLSVTYALVGSMLNSAGRAYIRLQVGNGDSYYFSDPIEVIIEYSAELESLNKTASKGEPIPTRLQAMRSAAPVSNEEYKTYSIVINYIFDNGGLAFEPYGASVAAGSDFEASIPSPNVVGYEPFRRITNDDGTSSYVKALTVDLNYTNVQENITVNVIYEPAVVDFQIHHHFQDILDDAYSEEPNKITYGKGLTGSIVPDNLALTKDELPGFKALAYENLTIAADGSTVVEIRYDRNYYLVSFELGGGFGTEPIYTRFGSTIGANAPTRPGYLFDGWELIYYDGKAPTANQKAQYDINNSNTIILPDAKLVYRANWITQITNYTMVFWKENINNTGFTFWGYNDKLQAMSGSYVSGADMASSVIEGDDINYFTYCDSLTDKNVLVEGDGSTVVNVYYTRNRYSLTFKAPGKCVIEENHVHTDECYIKFCKGGHTHTEECNPTITCPTEEHREHTAECIICGLNEHTHVPECCTIDEHEHTTACYDNVGSASYGTPNGAPTTNLTDGLIFRRSILSNYYIYILGRWYRYTGKNVSSGDIVAPSCGKENHAHSDECCDLDEHTHTDSCYKDSLHVHSDHCYSYSCGITAHEHSDSCLVLNCGMPTGHRHTQTCKSSSSTNVVKIVYKKYQENLGKDSDNLTSSDLGIWPIVDDNNVTYDDGQRWKPSGSKIYTQVLVYLANMPGESFTLTVDVASHNPYTMNYYLEVLPEFEGETITYDGKRFALYTQIQARYNHLTKSEDFFDIKGYDQHTSSPAFNSSGQISISGTNRNVNLYYTLQTDHELTFRSNGNILDDKTVYGIPYGASLSEYEFTPNYPAELEPNAFTFDGWYTSPGHYDGTEVDWDNIRMDAGGVLLYAKWSPVVHEVSVYTDNTLTTQIGETQKVAHRNFANAPIDTITNGNYIFQGWFYQDTDADGNPVEKAFVFNGIPVLEDINVYAKWSSHVSVNYTINYVLRDTGEQIADSTVGSGIAGHNKTFYAKAGEELYPAFKEGYYPLTSSHTVTMSAEADHEFTFEYVFVPSMPYAVRYVDEAGNDILPKKVVLENNLSVVTETFVKVSEMMPDAYQKRLILSANGTDTDGDKVFDNNVIVFRYKSDTEHAYYRVVHYIQQIADGGYREYRSEENIGVIGNTYTLSPLTLTGFDFKGEKTKIDGESVPTDSTNKINATLGADGLLIELYYDRKPVSYVVNYLEIGTNAPLRSEKKGNGIFGSQVIEYAPSLASKGYTLVSEEVKELHLSTNTTLNVINFYYQEAVHSIKYEIVGPDGAGTLSMTSENVQAVTGTLGGSYPIVSHGYSFHGWYLDEACKYPVDPSWVDSETNRLTPVRNGIWSQSYTYYAKIDPDFTSLKISTIGVSDVDTDQIFIFRIKGTSSETAEVDLTVMIIGNSSVTVSNLRIGSYSVTEQTSWSYRYTPDSEIKTISLSTVEASNSLTFSHIRSESKWLDGNDVVTNVFTKP